jgi:ABC-type microcin C transport system duplicated ATPase subunit YejF
VVVGSLGNAMLLMATAGQVLYRGQDITQLNSAATKALRKEIQIIFRIPFIKSENSVGKSDNGTYVTWVV